MKLKTKISAFFIVWGIILCITGSIFLYYFSFNFIKNEIHKQLEIIDHLEVRHIQTILTDYELRSRMFANNEIIINFLNNNNNNNINNEFKLFMETIGSIYRIELLDKNGKVIVSTYEKDVGKDKSNEISFIEGKKKVYIRNIHISEVTGNPGVDITEPIFINNEFLGLLVIDFYTDEIYDVLTNRAMLGDTGEVYLVDSNFNMTSPSRFIDGSVLNQKIDTINSKKCFSNNKILDDYEIDKINNDSIITKHFHSKILSLNNYLGTKVLGSHIYLEGINWCLISEISEEEVLAPLGVLLNLLIFIIFALILFNYFVSSFIGKKISDPVQKLKDGMEIIEKGDLDYRIKVFSKDEIGDLANEFNEMTATLKNTYEKIDEKVKEQTENTIKQKNDMEDQQKAILNILEDVEKEKDKTELIASDLKKFQLAVDNASDHIVITDNDGTVLYANKATENITGFSKKEMVGQKVGNKKLWGGRMEKSFYENMWKTIKKDKKVFTGEIENKRKNGEIYIALVSISPILDKGNNVIFFVGIERDITEIKKIDKMKTEFISIASHQLRTPITGIRWIIEWFLVKEKLSEKGKEYLEDIHMSTEKLSSLVDLLLNSSRIEEGDVGIFPQPIELVKFINDYIREAKPVINKKKLNVVFSDHPEKLDVISDVGAIRNIIQSIISNAIEYTDENGEIEIALIKINGTFMFEVSDNGIGIPVVEQEKIFTKFVRATNAKLVKTDGTGLGLYIAKKATDALNGKIWFDSPNPKTKNGTIFHVELPVMAEEKKGEKRLA